MDIALYIKQGFDTMVVVAFLNSPHTHPLCIPLASVDGFLK